MLFRSAWGIEFFGRAQVLEDHEIVKRWWIDLTYSYIDVDVDRDGGTHLDNFMDGALGLGPDDSEADGTTESHHTIGIRSHMNFVCDIELDLAYYYASKVKRVNETSVDALHRVDLRTAWHPTEHVEVSFAVENLFEDKHQEWNTELFISGTQVPRTFYGKVTLDF